MFFFNGCEIFFSLASFMKIDNGVEDDESEGSCDEGDVSSDLSRITELRLVPSDPSQGASFSFIVFHTG